MKESLQNTLEQYLVNLDIIRKTFKWDYDLIYPVCANLFVQNAKKPDTERIKDCKRIVKQSVSIFSSFRGNMMLPLACMLAKSSNPDGKWDQALNSYTALKQHFWGSEFLALAAVAMAESGSIDIEKIAKRGRTLYERMKKEHRFLTGSEDSVFSVLLAQSERSDDDLISDMERCYDALDQKFRKGNALQSTSHILALSKGEPEKKAERVIRIFEKIREKGGKYGKDYELPVLAAASLLKEDEDEIVRGILDAADKLRENKKYRGLFGYSKRARYMHAAMLVATDGIKETGEEANASLIAASQSALAFVIAQQIMICSMIASSAAVSAASSAH